MTKIVIVLDCGATNVRAIAIDQRGKILAQHSIFNETSQGAEDANYHIWDVELIWSKFVTCSKKIVAEIDKASIVGVTVTTFGVDGAPFDEQGNMLYPVISWKCPRTQPVMDNISKYIDPEELYQINGVQPASFNTINKLIWLKENKPEVIEKMHTYRFISSIFLNKLTNACVSERSMAGTSMLTDMDGQEFSKTIFNKLGLDSAIFPKMVDSGEQVGKVTDQASLELGIPTETPVYAAGHDTQYAIFGSGADTNELVISSGTWEILMSRTDSISLANLKSTTGITVEFDSKKGMYNAGCQWLASGVLEWVKNTFFADVKDADEVYDIMINGARKLNSTSIKFENDFGFHSEIGGSISGLTIHTKPAEIYLACLNYLADRMKASVQILEDATGTKSTSVICVGGGSKNKLWNQIKANTIGLPIKTINQKETTVLGAALFAFYGAGVYASPEEARTNVNYKLEIYNPE